MKRTALVLIGFAFGCRIGLAGSAVTVPSEGMTTIAEALVRCEEGDTIILQDGLYRESVMLTAGVVLKARTLLGAQIRGRGRNPVVTMAANSEIAGVVVQGGSVGVMSRSRGSRIVKCRIVKNERSGIMCIGHLPLVEDNVIAFNGGSGIQGQDVRSTDASVAHNTIAYNIGNGIALGGFSNVTVEYNIIAHNGKADVQWEGTSAQCVLKGNNLYRNGKSAALLPTGNISVDPGFAAARKLDFTLTKGSSCIRGANDGSDIGARLSR